jgi:hypothetical protein
MAKEGYTEQKLCSKVKKVHGLFLRLECKRSKVEAVQMKAEKVWVNGWDLDKLKET